MRKKALTLSQTQRIALYLFFFSINFEVWDPFSTWNFSISKAAGLVYLVTVLPQLKKFTRTGTTNYFMRPIWSLFGVLTLVSIYNINYLSSYFFDLTLFQNIILFWFLLNHERKDSLVLEKGLLSFAFGSVCLAILYHLGIGIEYEGGRVSIFGDNENTIGLRMCISMTILILAAGQNRLKFGVIRYLFLLPLPIMLQLMFQTGSRVSSIAFILASLTGIVLFKAKNIWAKIAVFIVSGILFIYGWAYMLKFEIIVQRLAEISETGVGQRELIWQTLLPLIANDPIFGIGLTGYTYFSQFTFGYTLSPHNVILEILCYSGFVGLGIFFIFLFRIFKRAYQSYTTEGLLLLLLLIFPVLGMILSGQILHVKMGWVVFAYIASSSIFKSNSANYKYRSFHV